MISAVSTLGLIGHPPIRELTRKSWDVIVVGAGHNGLTCAAYLARTGKRVLVLESNDRVGGACTLEETWPGYKISPCAYLCGLLHPLVIDELDLQGHGFEWIPAEAGMFVPFEDGSSVRFWSNEERCLDEVKKLSPPDVKGWQEMGRFVTRIRDALRPADERDLWLSLSPTRDEIFDRLKGDGDALAFLFEWSMADFVERFLEDERLHVALLGQGVIGTNANPFDRGTASIRFHHSSGRMFGRAGEWGYVRGGMGTVSFILCDIAREEGAVVAAGLPVGSIEPGEGVCLESGEKIASPVVISNADPITTSALLGSHRDPSWKSSIDAIPMRGCTVKLNVALHELPSFTARPGKDCLHHRGQINTPLTKGEWRENCAIANAGRLPDRLWTELYFQSALDRSIVPDGRHVMSVFAQYVPYAFHEGDWDNRRNEVASLALASIGRFCDNIPDAVEQFEVLGPPDIERKIRITGGHIFHGECLPDQMWDRRLSARTPHAWLLPLWSRNPSRRQRHRRQWPQRGNGSLKDLGTV